MKLLCDMCKGKVLRARGGYTKQGRMLKEDGAIVSVSKSPEEKRDRQLQGEGALRASAIRLDLRLAAKTELYQEARMTQSTKA